MKTFVIYSNVEGTLCTVQADTPEQALIIYWKSLVGVFNWDKFERTCLAFEEGNSKNCATP